MKKLFLRVLDAIIKDLHECRETLHIIKQANIEASKILRGEEL